MGNRRLFQSPLAIRRSSGSPVTIEQPDSKVFVETQSVG